MSAGLPRLSDSSLHEIGSARLPAYDRDAARHGVVHLGLGAFARGHVARYCDDLLSLGEPAAITGVSLRSGSATRPLASQDGLYTLIEADEAGSRMRIIGSVKSLVHGAKGAVAVISSPETRAISLTVTEKGYHRRSSGGIDLDHPAVASDLLSPDDPITAPGVIVAGLRRRRAAGLDGLCVVSCDNLSANGVILADVVVSLAAAGDTDLAEWIAHHVSFPSTVVDRIVPAATDADRQLVVQECGVEDMAPVRAEPHCSWVLENSPGLPPWDKVGARFVGDVLPWEQRKLRTVNAPHSALAYLGALGGHRTIDSAARDPELSGFVRTFVVDEAAPTLSDMQASVGETSAVVGAAIAADTLSRFRNPALGHRCRQVAADGSQKLPQRVVEVVAAQRAKDCPIDCAALIIAAWISWVRLCSSGKAELVDPLAAQLFEAAKTGGNDADSLAGSFLSLEAIFAPEVAEDRTVRRAVASSIRLIDEVGPVAAAARIAS